jgi:hypothetical protein
MMEMELAKYMIELVTAALIFGVTAIGLFKKNPRLESFPVHA